MENRGKLKAMFIIPSAIGVILFMIPVKNAAGEWTVTVKIIADIIAGAIGGFLPILSVAIVTISAVMTLVALAKPKFIMESPVLNSCFICGPFWIVVRVLGAIFAWITFLELGADKGSGILYAISSADQGGFVLYDLIGTLVIINVIASFLLPLLTDFGLLEYVGALATKLMRPLFKVPGRAAVDCVTSWIGDGTLGVMLTLNQYEGGYYTAKEASIIATLFSAVSITFALVVLDQVGMVQYFGVYYLLICFVGIICALICPLLWPLHKKPETYVIEGKAAPETIPEGYKSSSEYGMELALERKLHAVLAGALVALGDGLRRSFALDHIGLGLFVQGPQQRADQRADDADEADEQVVNAEVLHHPDLIEHDQRKGDGNGGEERRDDARLLSGVVAALILVEGQHDTERAVADPRGHAVDRGAAGDLEERAHELCRQRADILEQTEVGQQR